LGRSFFKHMLHTQVIENFVKEGKPGRGTYVKASEDLLHTQLPKPYRPYGSYWEPGGTDTPLAVRFADGSILANGARMPSPMQQHQWDLLQALEEARSRFAVIPFHSIVAAWTDGKVREWDQDPIPVPELKREVAIVVPSTGEQWQEVTEKDEYGREQKRQVHTLGDSVIRVQDRFYVSAVDETGHGSGMYFLAELPVDTPPASLKEALDALKPPAVLEAEARGSDVRRQGEWFAIPTRRLTSELMADVARGLARYAEHHVLGRDGHHKLKEAVIYRAGPRKGEVYARGVLEHTGNEHRDLSLGAIRWHLIVHNVQGASYTLSGRGAAQFD
jgi:hypothetical protein